MSYYFDSLGGNIYKINPITLEVTVEPPFESKPYTFWRIKQILDRDYHYELVNLFQGYKSNRRPGYRELYRIVDIDTGKTVIDVASLNGLRYVLTKEGYPLHDEGRKISAENWLESVQQYIALKQQELQKEEQEKQLPE